MNESTSKGLYIFVYTVIARFLFDMYSREVQIIMIIKYNNHAKWNFNQYLVNNDAIGDTPRRNGQYAIDLPDVLLGAECHNHS